MTATLQRTTFETSRLLDFCSEKELTAQTGHDREQWPLVVLKELLDNALDSCEEAGTPPEVSVTVADGRITVADNGPGIPAGTVKGILDYAVRVSSREAYVSPTRGAQGNALKTILAMPFVLDGDRGRVDITARGQRHEITFAVDRIAQRPVGQLRTPPRPKCKKRDFGNGLLAGFSKRNSGQRKGPFLTTCRRLHLAESTPYPCRRLARRRPTRRGHRSRLVKVASKRPDFPTLVRRGRV